MNVLICTILRDQRPNVERWLEQLNDLTQLLMGQVSFGFSIVENDSVDGTADWLRQHLTPGGGVWVSTEILGTQRYGSVWSLDRLRNLALARQKCLDQVGGALREFNKVCFVEPDVTYDPRWLIELILARHPRAAGLDEPDIYSGWSLRTEANPKESVFLYDVCATRATRDDLCWDVSEDGGRWRAASVVPTDLGGADAMCLHRVWSTFNCFCVYNARPFIEGVKWSWVNTRLNTGQQWIEDGDYGTGTLDADTACLCETFRAHGYSKVFLNTNALIRHT